MSSDDSWYERERLHFAASEGKLEEVKQLLANGYAINAFDEISRTPLHYAATSGELVVVQFLIEAGADVNAHEEEKSGETPLGEVVETCSVELARILIEAGADPTIVGWMGITALQRAARRTDPNGQEVHGLLAAAAKAVS